MDKSSTLVTDRTHIGFFGTVNAGKSSLVNAVTGQNTALVSSVRGTTTDPVRKTMEILPMGAVVVIDTPGFDDNSELGEARTERTKKVLDEIDVAVLVVDCEKGFSKTDGALKALFEEKKIPFVIAYNKADLIQKKEKTDANSIFVSTLTGENIHEFKELLARTAPEKREKGYVDSFVKKGDTVILVTPIDEAAPKGRIILPQQQVLRNLLDIGAITVVVQTEELSDAITKIKPDVVITDSQAFKEVSKIVPEDIPLTSFSILMAKNRGFLEDAVKATTIINTLVDGDKILIAEGCTHHRQCNDIGTVKIPSWIRRSTGKDIVIDSVSGKDFPEDLSEYKIVIHCGGCMITENEVTARRNRAKEQNVPFTNYGTVIAHINGILKRSVEVFPEIYNSL